jgi:hypothetical protein
MVVIIMMNTQYVLAMRKLHLPIVASNNCADGILYALFERRRHDGGTGGARKDETFICELLDKMSSPAP